ncbi:MULTISPECIES: mandelate racemase/muconate lactonizing enzyme family protein [unclassified Caballeronia]|jgi:D-galactarolactone cycloisomerase|uniref:mandelate racemase/muconate lactonizing enzyme family protein n=1 Tax=unclassified Caballeronia TaxID=2646786 RepID=UPI003ECCF1AC
MKITSIETMVVAVPFSVDGQQNMFAGRPWTTLDTLLVKITTEDGLIGWGEAFGHVAIPSTKAALDSVVAPLLIGADTTDIGSLIAQTAKKLHLLGRSGPFIYALSGIDIALWDIAAKREKKPLYELLGGLKHTRLPAYASLIWYGDSKLVAKNTAAACEAGYRTVKLHEISRESLLAAHKACGGQAEIILDTNCQWSGTDAVSVARSLAQDGLLWLEEPVWPPEDFHALAEVRKLGVRVAAGENCTLLSDFQRMFDAGAVDVVQPSVTKIGGITAMLAVIEAAKRSGVEVVPHSPYFGPGFLATLHIAASRLRAPPIEVLWMDMEPSPFDPWIRPQNGWLSLPEGHGLGCDPNLSLLERYLTAGPTVAR